VAEVLLVVQVVLLVVQLVRRDFTRKWALRAEAAAARATASEARALAAVRG
jgi:hypothetical protein